MRHLAALTTVVLLAVPTHGIMSPAGASAQPQSVTICHQPGTPAEKILTLPAPAAEAHLRHGDRAGTCQAGAACSAPPALPPDTGSGTEPVEDEPKFISEVVATLEGATVTGFNPTATPITFRLSCPTLQMTPDTVVVYDNGSPLPYESLALSPDSVTLTGGIASGRHELRLLAQDMFGYTIEAGFTLWAGQFSIPVQVLDESGAAAGGVAVTARLADDPGVSASLVTDADGRGAFANLPNRSYNIIAEASGTRFATRPASVFDGTVVLRLLGFKPASPIDNNDFSLGTAGWDIGSAPVAIVPHVEGSSGGLTASIASTGAPARTLEASSAAAAHLQTGQVSLAAVTTSADFDLVLGTSGEGQQSISRTFEVEAGYESVAVRFRFITSEVPGGWFGSEFNDFYNVAIRTQGGGGSIIEGNSMNGLGLAAFDSGGATGWIETELPIDGEGDTVQVNVAVANVADGLFDSQVVVDIVKKKTLTISQLQLNDIDNLGLAFLSASAHAYFSGNTRVHGTITITGPEADTLEELTLEVHEGGRIAVGTLVSGAAGALLVPFGSDGEIRLDASRFLFEVPGAQLAAANQSANGLLTLRVTARASSGETAEKDFGPVTKLVRFTGTRRYGQRDEGVGGDDWAKPTVRVLIAGTSHTWGDFSNMNGGPFPPHGSHRTGNSIDGWFDGYNARNASTAATIIGHLNTHGRRIQTVYVTFAPGSAFANAIAGVTLADGRAATAVIRNAAGHTTHFHWEVQD